MDIKELLSHVDHTLLKTTATWEQIKVICDEGIKYGTASVCIPPCYVKQAADHANGGVKICTVIGFPNGYNTAEVKALEAEKAVADGADEIDMVINVGLLKAGDLAAVEDEIRLVKSACGDKILKVIVETCLLTEEEKILMCGVCAKGGADYIKTSTGFSTGGATLEDIKLFTKHASSGLMIKAAGGISSIEDGETFIKAGAHRLGTSRIVSIAKEIGV